MMDGKKDFFHIRVEQSRKTTIELAASLTGVSLSDFVRDAAFDRAKEIIVSDLSKFYGPEADDTGSRPSYMKFYGALADANAPTIVYADGDSDKEIG